MGRSCVGVKVLNERRKLERDGNAVGTRVK